MTFNEEVEIIGSSDWTTEDNKTFTKTYSTNFKDEFEAKDLAGNTTDVIVTINNIDKEKPVITVNVDMNPIELEKGDSFTIPTANVTDNMDETIETENLKYDRIERIKLPMAI